MFDKTFNVFYLLLDHIFGDFIKKCKTVSAAFFTLASFVKKGGFVYPTEAQVLVATLEQGGINKPRHIQCLLVCKPDSHQSPRLPRERTAQGRLCAAPA